MAEVPKEQRKLKRWRRKDLNTNLLQVCARNGAMHAVSHAQRSQEGLPASSACCCPQVYSELKPRNLQALILDAAVWMCCDEEVVHKLDTVCFGNVDGGSGTAAYVRERLEAAGQQIQGSKAVRLSVDEAFFMAYALEILAVHDLVDGAAVAMDTTVGRYAWLLATVAGDKAFGWPLISSPAIHSICLACGTWHHRFNVIDA